MRYCITLEANSTSNNASCAVSLPFLNLITEVNLPSFGLKTVTADVAENKTRSQRRAAFSSTTLREHSDNIMQCCFGNSLYRLARDYPERERADIHYCDDLQTSE